MKKGILLLGLFMSVFNFNSLFGQCNNCPFVVGVDEYSITYAGQITGGDLSLTGDICINGLFIVEDVNVEFISSTVHLGKNAKIIVSPLLTLKISNSTLQSCDQINMWDKIEVKVGGTLKIDNSTVADAKLAIDFSGHIWNGQVGGVVLQKVTFNKNWISIYFHDFWNFGTSISRLDEVTIQSLTTTGQPTTSLLAPYNLYQRSSVGIWAAQKPSSFSWNN